MIIKLKHVAHKDSLKSAIIVFNVLLQMFSMLLTKDANHAPSIMYTITKLKLVTVKFHAHFQDNLMLTTFANALLTKKETEEYSTKLITLVHAQQISHSGTEDTVSYAQLELNSTKKKNNAITAQMDSSETDPVMLVFQDFDQNL
jgi:hypothetical protein